MSSICSLSNKVLLVILDGLGINTNTHKNAVRDAATPRLDHLFRHYPFTTTDQWRNFRRASPRVSGNSEVGHLNLGAGRPYLQDLVRINEAIEKKTLGDRPQLLNLINYTQSHGKRLHLMGLLSNGGVHSHIHHLKELLKIFSADPKPYNLFSCFYGWAGYLSN